MAITTLSDVANAFNSGKVATTFWNKLSGASTTIAITSGQWNYLGLFQIGSVFSHWDSIAGSTANLTQQLISDTTTTTATTAALGGSISGTTFTDTTHGTNRFTVGMSLSGTGVTPGTTIINYGTGTGANNGGTYTVNISQTVTNQTITGTGYPGNIYTGPSTSPNKKFLLQNSSTLRASTSGGNVHLLIDVLAQYTITSVTTTGEQSFSGSSAWPRYADGVGVRALLVCTQPMGLGSPTVQLRYTNENGVSNRLTPPFPLPTVVASSLIGKVPYTSNTGVGPFFPLQEGDKGIKSVETINFNASMTSGALSLIICKPITSSFAGNGANYVSQDFLFNKISLPRLYDGNNLQMLTMFSQGLTSNYLLNGIVQTVWE